MSDSERQDDLGGGGSGPDSCGLEALRLYVEKVIATAHLDLDVEVREDEEALVVDLDGPDNELLLSRRAEGLEALQLLLGKMLMRSFRISKSILVDCAGYRRGREREIVEIARRTAERVKRMRQGIELSPMNPYERRIVHVALSGDAGVVTSSSGDGVVKRVRIDPVAGREK